MVFCLSVYPVYPQLTHVPDPDSGADLHHRLGHWGCDALTMDLAAGGVVPVVAALVDASADPDILSMEARIRVWARVRGRARGRARGRGRAVAMAGPSLKASDRARCYSHLNRFLAPHRVHCPAAVPSCPSSDPNPRPKPTHSARATLPCTMPPSRAT